MSQNEEGGITIMRLKEEIIIELGKYVCICLLGTSSYFYIVLKEGRFIKAYTRKKEALRFIRRVPKREREP
jgi:hypothetical protein